MNNYFKERMQDIELRREQMSARKNYESEIESLEKSLKGLESNYQRLQTTLKSNLEQSALKQVDLAVAKDTHMFTQAMLDKNRVLLIEERRKLDAMHWQVWDEQIKVFDAMEKCLADNDSVSFLNEYPRVLNREKFALLELQEPDDETKKPVAENPEVKRLKAEIDALETAIKKAEDGCLSVELREILTELREFNRSHNHTGDETERLIEALGRSHRERMSLEAEISQKENRNAESHRAEKGDLKTGEKLSKDFPCVKREPQNCTLDLGLLNGEKWSTNELETNRDNDLQVDEERDKKLKAKKWYEEYVREIAVETKEDNYSDNFCPPVSQFDVTNIPSEEFRFKNDIFLRQDAECEDEVEFGVSRGNFFNSNNPDKRRSNYAELSQPVKSRFFEEKKVDLNSVGLEVLPGMKPKRNIEPRVGEGNVKVTAGSQETPNPNRKFEPLMAIPSTFLKSTAETARDYSVQSNFDEGLPSTQGVTSDKKSVKFTLKRPSKIRRKSAYRQTKLDDFDNFMVPDNKYTM